MKVYEKYAEINHSQCIHICKVLQRKKIIFVDVDKRGGT